MTTTKKQIREASTLELSMKFNLLILMGDTMEAKDISVADARELIWIEDELHRRLIKVIGHDFYPPTRLEKNQSHAEPSYKPRVLSPLPQSNTIKSILGRGSKPETVPKLSFKITVLTSVGSKASVFTVEAGSKSMAEKLARKKIWKTGLQGATFKIS